jgi:4-amino-4-deoxy-L-arabinose transferase-like glycosyltransferase
VKKPLPPIVYALLLAAVAAGAAVCILLQIGQPLVADEPQLVDVAYSLSRTAEPMGYSGSDWNPILSHPLLYHSLVAVPVGFAGKAPWAGRLVGVIFFFAAGALLWAAVRRITGERWGPFLAVLLYALHPLAVQSALLVEIDTAVLPLFAVLFIWFLVRRAFALDGAGWLAFGLLFGVSLAAKMTTPPLLLVALGLYYLAARRPRQLAYLAAAAGLGVALFAVYYFPYCALRGLPVGEPFGHLLARAAPPGDAFGDVILKRGVRIILWLGVPFAAAYAMVVAQRGRRWLIEGPPAVAYGALAALVILVFYLLVGGDGYGFVKYHAPMVPLVALVLGASLGPELARESKATLLFLGALAFVYYLLVARDPLYWPYVAREAREVLAAPPGDVTKALTLTGAFVVLPLIAFVVMTRRGGRTLAFVILAVAAGPALDAWHAYVDYEHRYNYGERGMVEAATELHEVPADLEVVVPVDVAFAEGYAHPHVAVEDVLGDAEAFRRRLNDPRTGAVILRDSYFLHDAYRGALEDELVLITLNDAYDIARRGSFTVAVRRTRPGPEE